MRIPFLSAALVATVSLSAQQTTIKPFQESPAATVSQDLGISTVKIDYHRPAVKGRKIWGALVPFGEVWRAGANEATVITLSDPMQIGEQTLPAGAYALFAIPGPDTWTLIFSRNAKQWGAYNHKAADEVLKLQVKPRTAPFQEYLGFNLQLAAPGRLRVELAWENLAVGFDATLDVRATYWAYLEGRLAVAKADEWLPWFQGANYCFQNNLHMDKAMGWVDASLKAKETYRNLELKARLLHKAGRTTEALPLLQKATDLATAAKTPKEYLDELAKAKAEWTAAN